MALTTNPKKKKSNYYVDNKKLYADFVVYKEKYNAAKEAGTQLPRLPDSIGSAILLIADGYSRKKNFYFLPYREEMVGDAIETCVRYAYNFDPSITRNPFAYLTRIIHRAFLQRIAKEKKDQAKKTKLFKKMVETGEIDLNDSEAGKGYADFMMKHIDEQGLANEQFNKKNDENSNSK